MNIFMIIGILIPTFFLPVTSYSIFWHQDANKLPDEECPVSGVECFPRNNCSEYKKCNYGYSTIEVCPQNLFFDPNDDCFCNWPDEVPECIGGTRPPSEPPTVTVEPSTVTTLKPVDCPSDGYHYIPHDSDCQMYHVCFNGNHVETKKCADGSLFDPVDHICKDEGEVECEIPTEPPKLCPDEGFHQIRHETYCHKYYVCYDGDLVATKECVDGYFFDSEDQQCKPESEVDCQNPTPAPPPLCQGDHYHYVPHETECQKYLVCFNGEVIQELVCANEFLFDPNERVCKPEGEVDCGHPTPPPFTCPPDAGYDRFEHEERCEKYYVCLDGVMIEVGSCDSGMFFDPTDKHCKAEDLVDCQNPTLPPKPLCEGTHYHYIPHEYYCKKYYICFGGVIYDEGECGEDLLFDPLEKKCKLQEDVVCEDSTTPPPPPDCPSEGIHNIPNPADCQKYYVCIDGEIKSEEGCADGLLFDPIDRICKRSELVDCSSTPGPPTTTLPPKPECPPEGTEAIPHESNCQMFYICFHGEIVSTRECDEGELFDPEERKCKPEDDVECNLSPANLAINFFRNIV